MRRLIAIAAVTVIAIAGAVIAVSVGGGQSSASASGGGSSTGAYGSAAPMVPAKKSTSSATVSLRSTSLGKILVDSNGMTLYLFEKDTSGMSNCSGSCASVWPPSTASGSVHAGKGVKAAKLTTISRSGGQKQLSYNGHPLYRYAGDSKPGQTKGEGLNQFGAKWYVLNAAGNKIDKG
jgi:predicted lipoprotein with Yx(FWY)xxD motif